MKVKMELSVIAQQVVDLIKPESLRGAMLPKTQEQVIRTIQEGRGFWAEVDGQVVSFVAIYEWPNYTEIGSVVTHCDFRRQGYASQLITIALENALKISEKPIIALTNTASTHLLESLGFVYKEKKPGNQEFWEPCKQTCVDYGRWPKCNCHFMQLEKSTL